MSCSYTTVTLECNDGAGWYPMGVGSKTEGLGMIELQPDQATRSEVEHLPKAPSTEQILYRKLFEREKQINDLAHELFCLKFGTQVYVRAIETAVAVSGNDGTTPHETEHVTSPPEHAVPDPKPEPVRAASLNDTYLEAAAFPSLSEQLQSLYNERHEHQKGIAKLEKAVCEVDIAIVETEGRIKEERQKARDVEELRLKRLAGKRAVVVYDYDKDDDSEISLALGEVITEMIDVDEDWAEGLTKNGERGQFPRAYVNIVEETARPTIKRKPRPSPAQ